MKNQFLIKIFSVIFRWDTPARIALWEKLCVMLNNNVSIVRALQFFITSPVAKASLPVFGHFVLSHWYEQMRTGHSFADAISGWVSSEEVMIIRSGEQSDRLSAAIESARFLVKAKSDISATIISSSAYPCALIIAAFGVLYLFGLRVIPEITRLSLVHQWQGHAALLVRLSQMSAQWFWQSVFVCIFIAILVLMSLPYWDGIIRSKFDNFGPWAIYRIMMGSAWLFALSSLIASGMRLQQAMRALCLDASPWLRHRIEGSLSGIRSGLDLSESLLTYSYGFPDRQIIAELSVYERYEHFDQALMRLSKQWIERCHHTIKQRMRVLFIVLLLAVGLLCLFMASGVIDMQRQIAQSAQLIH